jgi:DNA-binding GntR family transcriptional regulator
LNLRFHHYIACLSGNERLASLIRQLHLDMKRMNAAGWNVPGHAKLLSAFRERNPKRAAKEMRDQILAVRDEALRLNMVGSPATRPD